MPASHHVLRAVGRTHLARLETPFPTADTQRYVDLEGRLASYAIVSAAACPPLAQVLDGLAAVKRPELNVGLLTSPGVSAGLDRWLTCLTAALTHRARLDTDDVRTFAAPVLPFLPRIEAVLNSPV